MIDLDLETTLLPDLAAVLNVPSDREINLGHPAVEISKIGPNWSRFTMMEIHYATRRGMIAGFAFMGGNNEAFSAVPT